MVDQSGQGGPSGPGAPASQASGIICPHCGVTVAPGYPKCPKCHGGLPTVVSPLHRTGTLSSGGTTAAEETGSLAMWIAIGTVVIVLGAVVYFIMRDPGGGTSAAAADAGTELLVADGDGGADDLAGEDLVAPEQDDDGAAIEAALDALGDDLATRRLWSGLEAGGDDGSTVRIESAYCEDPSLQSALDEHAGNLRDAGFRRVECYERHGTLVSERDL
jgi:hypothetical protein